MKFNQINRTNSLIVKSSQRGVSLFDFVLWFAIAGAFLAAIYSIFAPSRTQTRANNVFIELQTSQSSIRSAYSGDASAYKDMTLETLSKSRIIPTSIKSSGGDGGFSAEGGAISIKGEQGKFTIIYSALPVATSNLLINKLSMDDWNSVKVDDADCKADINSCKITPAKASVKLTLESA